MTKLIRLTLIAVILSVIASPGFAKSLTHTVKVSLRVLPIMELEITGPAGGNIEFGDIQKDGTKNIITQAKDVIINAKTNMATPYIIQQELLTPISNAKGEVLTAGAMTVNASNEAGRGQSMSNVSALTTPNIIYRSDARGRSDSIKAQYHVNIPPTQAAGSYESALRYTFVTA
ncbi:MAG: hypothetical protein ACI9CF_002051 [Candidatus Omnitrophota bacterium]|jgi:hypothetical protein